MRKMKATIENSRQGPKTQHTDQFILLVDGVKDKADATKLLGKKVVWKTQNGDSIIGKVTRLHGSKGSVLAKFNKGLPGQAIGTKADII
jgi:large subunit ribosomal protein L35Ae